MAGKWVKSACVLASLLCVNTVLDAQPSGLVSFDTGYTICKVRTVEQQGSPTIIASSYEGTLLSLAYDGAVRWKNELSGFMNHDLWCADLTGDGSAEILAANADGSLYCLGEKGRLLWQFKKNEAPMYAVCVVRKEGVSYVVCGGYDKNIYYLSSQGTLVKTIASSTYSRDKPWPNQKMPPAKHHTANWLRPVGQANGSDWLAVQGVIHGMNSSGSLYLFEALADKPFSTQAVKSSRPIGELRVCAKAGGAEILMGTSQMLDASGVVRYDPLRQTQTWHGFKNLRGKMDGFGYRVTQPEIISDGNSDRYFVLFGTSIILAPADLDVARAEVLRCRYSFNDMWHDRASHRIVLASSQSGGSCVHVVDLKNPDWKQAYRDLTPPGKIQAILDQSRVTRDQVGTFARPSWERQPPPVYMLSSSLPRSQPDVRAVVQQAGTPIALGYVWLSEVENWDRSAMPSEKYRKRRDQRKKYTASQEQILNRLTPRFGQGPGIAYWGGHGNDPYLLSLDTQKKVIDAAGGKKVVMIYPELEDETEEFEFVLQDLVYPLARYAQGKDTQLYLRNKHTFWQSTVYLPMWSRLLSGEFADVLVPAMEETSDKSMELSVAARTGLWLSGAVNQWGARCARDNTSFDRLRQHSHQMLPNHFLRQMVYNLSLGARYLNNFSVNQDYMSLLWMLIAKGVLYVPERSELISLSPVHLSMLEPDEHYVESSNNVKWTTFYDQTFEGANPFVFSRLNGTWPGAPVTAWDFSRYAAGVKERRLNFLPPYENGLVLITPPQQGGAAAKHPPRGALKDHLHPLYRDLLKEYYTDGRHYVSADGTKQYGADTYYQAIAADIRKGAKNLPLTVSGDVAWVAAQTAPKHLRLTLIDSGYINPQVRTASVHFHTAKPKRMVDLLNRETYDLSENARVEVSVPCGLFRFMDIELIEPLQE